MTYTPKDVVAMTGLSIHTLRYYERVGLLEPVRRKDNGHRCYDDEDLRRLRFIKRMRATGMPIREMLDYIALYRQGESTRPERREMLLAHRERVQAQLDDLHETLAFIDRKIALYANGSDCAGDAGASYATANPNGRGETTS